ncbi:non-ribosomal peptide synthetase [Nocardia asteroides]|uniref:non-ribosomal peptide synthetase n=1 Tax=Nocardia asteroides TaxID=1824 RepID=UPI001E38D4D5|nr:non-ribosomal peptide synthetase [Nocardia asteroides]UGT62037.1 amino acid adenylation domain-containing protein [Nocardia asteroides]
MRPASPIQRHLVLAAALRPADPAQNWALLSRLPAGTDPVRFAAAVEAILHGNRAFTETFTRTGSGDIVVTPTAVRAPVPVTRYPDLAAVQAEVRRLGDSVFDPAIAPLHHAEIATAGADAYFLFAGAHVLSDGFGFYNLLADFAARYADPAYTSPDPGSPADAADAPAPSRADAVRHFGAVLAGLDDLRVEGWRDRDPGGRITGGIRREPLPRADYDRAKPAGTALGVRRYTVLLATLALTAGCLAGTDTVVVSTPMSNRRSGAGSATTRGVRVNALPIRFDLRPEVGFAELCARTEAQLRGLLEFEQLPFSEFSRSLIGSEAMDATQPSVAFTLYPRPLAAVVDGVAGEALHVDRRYLQHPLSVTVEVGADEPALLVQRADQLPDADIGALYRHVLHQVVADPEHLRLGAISWAEGDLAARVEPVTAFPRRSLAEEFATAVARDPDGTAVLTDDERLSYAELDACSDAVAAWLRAHVPGALVGVTIAPSVRLVATMLGVFKAGKVYVPIDVAAAPARVAQIAAACPDITIVTGPADQADASGDALPEAGPRTVAMPERLPPAPASAARPGPDDLAYIIFTSGTTGAPKGVRIGHDAAVRFFDGLRQATGIGAERWLLFHSMSFDISIVETLGALFSGGAVCIPGAEVKRDPAALGAFLDRHRVAVVSQTPSAFAMHGPRLRELTGLRHVLLCGERLEYGSVAGFVAARPDVAVMNCYGITETTMYHTAFRVPARPPERSVIGRPFADTGMAVVDAAHRVLPRGVPGQLVVSGPGLMLGYLQDDEPTRARIVEIDGVPSYLSGDRGTLGADGQFVVAGRMDTQVKIRGHRLEPGEVERAVHRTGLVANAHVRVAGAGLTAELVCFLVLNGDGDLATVRERLDPLLPRAFHPDRYLVLPVLPVNANGKLDAEALTRLYTADRDTAPAATPDDRAAAGLDAVVTEVWSEVLGSTEFDGSTRFFDAGGTSAMVLQVGERLRARLGLPELSVVDLFEHCTPDTLTEFLAERA